MSLDQSVWEFQQDFEDNKINFELCQGTFKIQKIEKSSIMSLGESLWEFHQELKEIENNEELVNISRIFDNQKVHIVDKKKIFDCHKAILISQSRDCKDQFMKILFPQQKRQKILSVNYQEQMNWGIIETEDFDFDNIDEREKQISQYKEISNQNESKINTIIILVKFERIDIMKKKVMEIYKFFKIFQSNITIIVTDFHLSENIQTDQELVIQSFKLFDIKSIIFIEKNTIQNELIIQLNQNTKYNIPIETLKLKDTIFESMNSMEKQQIMDDMILQLKN